MDDKATIYGHKAHNANNIIPAVLFDSTIDAIDGVGFTGGGKHSQEHEMQHMTLLGQFLNELEIQDRNRRLMARDQDMNDNEHWSPEKVAILQERGQEAITYNVVSTVIQWLVGTERRTRTDYKIMPRSKEAAKAATLKTKFLKYLSDANDTPVQFSMAFQDAVTAGIGWVESGFVGNEEETPIVEEYVDWRSVIYDSAAIKGDLSDGRYIFRMRWVDLDVAQALLPESKHELAAASTSDDHRAVTTDMYGDAVMDSQERFMEQGTGFNYSGDQASRNRVRLIEGWFKVPTLIGICSGGVFNGEIFDPYSRGHVRSVIMGEMKVKKKMRMVMHRALFTTSSLIKIERSPYRHNGFPLTPIFAYRRASNKQPYSPIRALYDIQQDINMRASKALSILSTNKVIMESGAVEDIDKLAEEIARPDSIIEVNTGKDFKLNTDRELASAHLSLMQMGIGMIENVGGVTAENQGQSTNANSGRAIIAKQEQGAMATATLFDNLRQSRSNHGRKLLSITEQYAEEEQQFRISQESRPTAEYATINDQEDQDTDITNFKDDFIVGEAAWSQSHRAAQAAELTDLLAKLAPTSPQIAMTLLDLVVEAMDVPSREEIVKRIRQITGFTDPDSEPDMNDPEVQAQMQAKQQQAAMQERQAKSLIEDQEAATAHKKAQTKKTLAEADKTQASISIGELEKLRTALETATALLSMPAAAPVADTLMQEAEMNAPQLNMDDIQQQQPQQAPQMQPEPPVDPQSQPQPII